VDELISDADPPREVDPPAGGDASAPSARSLRLRALLDDNYDFIWRQLRRLGLSDDAADDAAQQVFIVASRKLDVIAAGSERSFLLGTAIRVASDIRRASLRRREVGSEEADDPADPGPRADELLDRERARQLLDEALAGMTLEHRSVFVLFEIEELTMAEIAKLLTLPAGTVASRLRRAREEYDVAVNRLTVRERRRGAR
jgi:RNA polymerase sigma-70 factor (ECF subfamily)